MEISEVPKKLWIKFSDKSQFEALENDMMDILKSSDGKDEVVVYISDIKAMKKLPPSHYVEVNDELLDRLKENFGEDAVAVTNDVGRMWK